MASLSPDPRTTTPQRCSVAYFTDTACCGNDGSTRPAGNRRGRSSVQVVCTCQHHSNIRSTFDKHSVLGICCRCKGTTCARDSRPRAQRKRSSCLLAQTTQAVCDSAAPVKHLQLPHLSSSASHTVGPRCSNCSSAQCTCSVNLYTVPANLTVNPHSPSNASHSVGPTCSDRRFAPCTCTADLCAEPAVLVLAPHSLSVRHTV
jgi:hypothetical protein